MTRSTRSDYGNRDPGRRPRIAVIHSNAAYLTGLRLPLLRHLRERADILAFAPRLADGHLRLLAELGIEGRSFELSPTGLNPFRDALDTVRLARTLRAEAPDAVLTNTIKPVIFGTFAASLAGVARRYALVSGLGYAFTDAGDGGGGLKKRLVRRVTSFLYRIAFRLNRRVIFQNPDDMAEVVAAGICAPARAAWVPGSGVDVDAFSASSADPRPSFIMVGRLLAEKGVREYLRAARIAKQRVPEATFLLVGDVDPNPSAIDPGELQPYLDDGIVEWPGAVPDVRPWLQRASVFVLPSYREGIPRSTLEAMAIGLAVITTDAPGCRQTVPDGANGLLVPVRDAEALADAMVRLATDLPLVAMMGQASRALAESAFDIAIVHRRMDELMDLAASEGAVA